MFIREKKETNIHKATAVAYWHFPHSNMQRVERESERRCKKSTVIDQLNNSERNVKAKKERNCETVPHANLQLHVTVAVHIHMNMNI